MYRKIISRQGREMYYRDQKLVAKNTVPPEELEKLNRPEEPKKPVFDPLANLDVTVLDEEGGLEKYHPHLHHNETVAGQDEAQDNEDVRPLYDVPEECLFCGGSNDFQKLLNLDGRQYTVNLCESDYYSKNLGKMVGKLRSLKHESIVG